MSVYQRYQEHIRALRRAADELPPSLFTGHERQVVLQLLEIEGLTRATKAVVMSVEEEQRQSTEEPGT